LNRWTLCLTLWDMSDLVDSDAHIALISAVDMIAEEKSVLLGCDAFKATWEDFATTVHNIGNGAEETPLAAFHPHRAAGHYRWPAILS